MFGREQVSQNDQSIKESPNQSDGWSFLFEPLYIEWRVCRSSGIAEVISANPINHLHYGVPFRSEDI